MKLRFAGAALAAVLGFVVGPVQVEAGNIEDPARVIISYPGDEEASGSGPAASADQVEEAMEVAALPDDATVGDDLIASHAETHGVPVALARAVVRIESNFDPKARGRAGEIGLMQIKPQTARGIGYQGNVEALYDPDTNLRWGMKYLAGAYQRAGGDICGTVMRYQGGHYATRMTGANRTYCGRVKSLMGQG